MGRGKKWDEPCAHINVYIPARFVQVVHENDWDASGLLVEAIIGKMSLGSLGAELAMEQLQAQLVSIQTQIEAVEADKSATIISLQHRGKVLEKQMKDIEVDLARKQEIAAKQSLIRNDISSKQYEDGGN